MDPLSDAELLRRFECADIPLSEWNHRAHLRIAYAYLRKHPAPKVCAILRERIQAFNAAKKIENSLLSGYHETMTVAYVRLIDFTMRQHGALADSTAFLAAQPQLCVKSLLRLYYSREMICTWEAKTTFLAPDLAPFPKRRF